MSEHRGSSMLKETEAPLTERRFGSGAQSPPRIAIVHPSSAQHLTETFIRAHIERLNEVVTIVHLHNECAAIDDRPLLSQNWLLRARRRLAQRYFGYDWMSKLDEACALAIRQSHPAVVLAEFGTTGVHILNACRKADIPLVVHFHGYDASRRDVFERYAADYSRMFHQAAAVIVVSRAMERRLSSAGCPQEKLVYSPYGIDCSKFSGAQPASAAPVFAAVGRLIEKKAPHLTIAAFGLLLQDCPEARLRVIGEGPLLCLCRELAAALGVDHAVSFLGPQSHDAVQRELRKARAFVQHSMTARDGDSEGTPVAILEACATGLPVVSTRHAGIPDIVVEGQTGLLVAERDVLGMACAMRTLAHDPTLAATLGRKAADRVRAHYTMKQSINRLACVIAAAVDDQSMTGVRQSIEAELPARPEPAPEQPIASLSKLRERAPQITKTLNQVLTLRRHRALRLEGLQVNGN